MRSNDPRSSSEGRLVLGGVVRDGTELGAVRLLGGGLAEDGHLRAEGNRELDAEVAEATEAHDGNLLAGAGTPALQRVERRDAGAQQRRRDVELEGVGDAEGEALADHDLLAVATHRLLAVVALTVVRHHRALDAELLLAVLAVLALAAGVDHAADADPVTDLVARHTIADLGHDAGDLVTGHHREDGAAPLLADLVDVAVADPGEGDVDDDVVIAQLAPFDRGRLEGGSSGRGGQGCSAGHGSPWGGRGQSPSGDKSLAGPTIPRPLQVLVRPHRNQQA